MNAPVDKFESALVAIIQPALDALGAIFDGATATAVTSKESSDRPLPVVICACQGNQAEEEPKGSGNCWLDAEISIKHRAKDEPDAGAAATAGEAKTLDQELVSAVREVVYADDLAQQLTDAEDDFTVHPGSVQFNSPSSGQDDQGIWVDQINLRALCCASDLA